MSRLRPSIAPELEDEEPVDEGPTPPASRPGRRISRPALAGIALAALVVLLALVSRHFDEYLRRTLEAKINQRLHGYSVTLGGAHLRPLSLALVLTDMVVRQQAHPDPPVIDIPRLKAGVEWQSLLRFHLVGHAVFDHPRLHVDLTQLRQESRDAVPMKDRGWQGALESIYPLKFNWIEVREGEAVYVDQDPKRPLMLSHWNLTAENIRNIRSGVGVYPSSFHTEAVLFETGRARLTGHADFLSEPFPGVHALYQLDGVPLARLEMFSSRANLEIQGGLLDSRGEVQYAPRRREAHVVDLTVRRLRLDYVHAAATAAAEKRRAVEAAHAAANARPAMRLHIDRVHLADGVLGFVNRAAPTPYRVYLDAVDLTMSRLSSGLLQGPADVRLRGRFMGSGSAKAHATFREPRHGPNFDLTAEITGASLPKINDFLRAYGKLDVTEGTFSVYTQLEVKDRRIRGYVKPLFSDVKVYDPKQDKSKPVLKKLYEKVVGGLSHLLENRPRDEVATVADLSGSIDDPDTDVLAILGRLIRNAFIKAILPGFERQIEALRHRK